MALNWAVPERSLSASFPQPHPMVSLKLGLNSAFLLIRTYRVDAKRSHLNFLALFFWIILIQLAFVKSFCVFCFWQIHSTNPTIRYKQCFDCWGFPNGMVELFFLLLQTFCTWPPVTPCPFTPWRRMERLFSWWSSMMCFQGPSAASGSLLLLLLHWGVLWMDRWCCMRNRYAHSSTEKIEWQ